MQILADGPAPEEDKSSWAKKIEDSTGGSLAI